MSRRLAVALACLLAVLALVVGAPALKTPTGSADSDAERIGAGQRGPSQSAPLDASPTASGFVMVTLLVALVVALAYGLRQYRRSDAVLAAATTVGLTALAAALVAAEWNPTVAGAFTDGTMDQSAVDSTTSVTPGPDSLWLVGAVGSFALVVLAGVVLFRATDAETWAATDGDTETGDGAATEDPTALGEAAGRAADRIADDAPLDNVVYRAWREMTDALDVPDPETSTPGEFQAAAVDAGMDSEDVAVLTDLFETVRYGDQPATEERERRAERALRNVERTYERSL
ncbi:DUF4129 domain-containing protein [Halomicroarcula limicola]|uniref:DUF4129 domain-containing protein n=1 Tax=Haloarcula limicola TaxID=1429915 RepID=A0A8J7Y448_9EURY|nr:DUF4129 domain-containing protein [Halomicroarcula limicola]MBV0923852.1 DUF4129 domain-containing protein [Halomicroarcula limicola]